MSIGALNSSGQRVGLIACSCFWSESISDHDSQRAHATLIRTLQMIRLPLRLCASLFFCCCRHPHSPATLTAAQVNAAIRKHFKPEVLSVFAAGDFKE
jgi:hypothetical protein